MPVHRENHLLDSDILNQGVSPHPLKASKLSNQLTMRSTSSLRRSPGFISACGFWAFRDGCPDLADSFAQKNHCDVVSKGVLQYSAKANIWPSLGQQLASARDSRRYAQCIEYRHFDQESFKLGKGKPQLQARLGRQEDALARGAIGGRDQPLLLRILSLEGPHV